MLQQNVRAATHKNPSGAEKRALVWNSSKTHPCIMTNL
jgi:hypothetical protein